MKEIEVKILNINREEVESKLKELGATKVFEGVVTSDFFSVDSIPDEDLGTIRVRTMNEKAFLTVKKKIQHESLKVREEYEVEVSNAKETRAMVEALGFKKKVTTQKNRTSYEFDGIRFEFDKHTDHYNFIPEYLEIEAKDEETVLKAVKMLGFSKEDCKPWTAKDIAEHMKNE